MGCAAGGHLQAGCAEDAGVADGGFDGEGGLFGGVRHLVASVHLFVGE